MDSFYEALSDVVVRVKDKDSVLLMGGQCLKDVRFRVQPAVVERGRPASLLCEYDLEGAPLYAVKWYRGRLEFFRYSPSERPVYKIFPFPGISVDLSSSNATQVVLKSVGLSLSGNFSCEVTADASFLTKTVSATMHVVALPEGPPTLVAERERYYPGDLLRANCSAPPSRPAAQLSFYINDEPVGSRRPDLSIKELPEDESQSPFQQRSSGASLRARLLPSDFAEGRLSLKCAAEVADIYFQAAELQLGSRPEPVPQRVTASNRTATAAATSSRADVTASLLVVAATVYVGFFR
ncbi:uncharacterized protein LOC126092904 [Schistocerca cancellata]|uniref:uncharacterized protein LOC126092904 n=1 Tax=Schistocerca cancellata TaxID=274614 RepID=UPI00211879FD|nr:uncharacterized protein LOC126092904 [Schistocerca cancellata]